MTNLESIVPPLELCRLIPVGKFEDSAAVFVTTWACPDDPFVATREEADANGFDVVCCAPTLQEILEALPTIQRTFEGTEFFLVLVDYRNKHSGWGIGYGRLQNGGTFKALNGAAKGDKSSVNAALRLWLEINKKS